MANPQKENGYVAISTELFEAMVKFRVPGECEQVLKAIIRKTYGYNKKEDNIANSQIVALTGLKKANVSRALSKLITNKLVIKTDNNNKKGHLLKINKNYQEWIAFVIKSDNSKKPKKKLSKKKPVLSKVITSVIKSDNKTLSKVMDTIDNNHIKDNIQKTRENTPSKSARIFFKGIKDLIEKNQTEEAILTRSFLQELEKEYPKAKKDIIWSEIKKFYFYWTELNGTGTKQRWQKQDAFQVDRRLVTWFGKIDQFKRSENIKETKFGKL